jgi:hypothetical protein
MGHLAGDTRLAHGLRRRFKQRDVTEGWHFYDPSETGGGLALTCLSKSRQLAANTASRLFDDFGAHAADWGNRMHGGMNVLDRPDERFEKQADDYIKRAESDSEDPQFWLSLALECLRYAAADRNRGR